MIVTACTQHQSNTTAWSNADMAVTLKYGRDRRIALGKGKNSVLEKCDPICPNAIIVVAKATVSYVLAHGTFLESLCSYPRVAVATEGAWIGFCVVKGTATTMALDRVKACMVQFDTMHPAEALATPLILLSYHSTQRSMSGRWGAKRAATHLFVALKKAALVGDVRQSFARVCGMRTHLVRQTNGFDKVCCFCHFCHFCQLAACTLLPSRISRLTS